MRFPPYARRIRCDFFLYWYSEKEKGGNEMSMQPEKVINKTAKPVVAGVFNIVIGSFCLLGVLGLLIAAAVVTGATAGLGIPVSVLLIIIAVPLAIVGGLALAGGIVALQRRLWGLALAGSIVTFFICNIFGITSTVLIAVSRDEFTA
jgi:hypothetical protein